MYLLSPGATYKLTVLCDCYRPAISVRAASTTAFMHHVYGSWTYMVQLASTSGWPLALRMSINPMMVTECVCFLQCTVCTV